MPRSASVANYWKHQLYAERSNENVTIESLLERLVIILKKADKVDFNLLDPLLQVIEQKTGLCLNWDKDKIISIQKITELD